MTKLKTMATKDPEAQTEVYLASKAFFKTMAVNANRTDKARKRLSKQSSARQHPTFPIFKAYFTALANECLKRAPKSETSTDGTNAKLEDAINNLLISRKFETREAAIEFLRTDQPELFKKQDEPKPEPATDEELATAIHNVLVSGKAFTRKDALRFLRDSRPELFGEKQKLFPGMEDDETTDEEVEMSKSADAEVFAKCVKALQARTYCSKHDAEQSVRLALANGTITKVLGAEGLRILAQQSDNTLEAVQKVRDANPGASRVDALRSLRKAAQNSGASEFDQSVAKHRANGLSGVEAMRAARRELV